MNMDNLKLYVKLDAERLDLQKKVDALKKELAPLEEKLLNDFATEGVQSVKVDGRLAYLYPSVWARPLEGDYERACRALARYGLASMVHKRFDIQTLSAHVRELKERGETLHPNLLKVIAIEDKFDIRTKKA